MKTPLSNKTDFRPGSDRSARFVARARLAILWERVWRASWPASGILGLFVAAALFDAFEAKGAARLAAWLELTGEGRRLTETRAALQDVLAAQMARYDEAPAEALEDFVLACITMALAVGLFGPALSDLLGKPAGQAREVVLGLLLSRLESDRVI